MSEPFVAEIRIVGFNFAPSGWATCDGQILSIAQNTALFSLLGTTFGGNGQTNFALPNLQGRAPMHPGQGPGLSQHDLGEISGSESVTLIQTEIPAHNHNLNANNSAADRAVPAGAALAQTGSDRVYGPVAQTTTLSPSALGITGGSQPHNNMQPYLAVNFVIAMEGIYPPRS